MDYTILWALLIIGISLLSVFGYKYLKNKNMLKDEDLQIVSDVLDLSLNIIQQLNIQNINKEELKIIVNLISIGLVNVTKISQITDKEEIIKQVQEYVSKLCKTSNIILDDNKKNLINNLIKLTVNKINIDN